MQHPTPCHCPLALHKHDTHPLHPHVRGLSFSKEEPWHWQHLLPRKGRCCGAAQLAEGQVRCCRHNILCLQAEIIRAEAASSPCDFYPQLGSSFMSFPGPRLVLCRLPATEQQLLGCWPPRQVNTPKTEQNPHGNSSEVTKPSAQCEVAPA